MTSEPRAALDRLIAALEAHLAAAARRTGEGDPAVIRAGDTLAEAFRVYDDALYDAYDEVTPFVVYEEPDDFDEDDEDDDEDYDDEEVEDLLEGDDPLDDDDLDDDEDVEDEDDEPVGATAGHPST